MNNTQIIISIVIMSLVTMSIRALPFVVFKGKNTPAWINKLGASLPYAVMGMLVVYCLKDVEFTSMTSFLPELIASAIVVISYILKRNSLLSIILGTLSYMALVQFVFV